jgi:hypothetical protein
MEPMNRLELGTEEVDCGGGFRYQGLTIHIDGRSFIRLVCEVERPMAAREGHPDLAGSYAWVPADKDALRELQPQAEPKSKPLLLQCACGEAGCWPLLADVITDGDVVTWTNFEQPHRGPDSGAGCWRYEGFGPFVFDAGLYAKEVARLKAALQLRA